MREVADFGEERDAERLADVLAGDGIVARVLPANTGRFAVWVVEEGDLARARELTLRYQAGPDGLDALAERGKKRRAPAESKAPPAVIDPRRPKRHPVTNALVFMCVFVAIVTELGEATDVVSRLSFAGFRVEGGRVAWDGLADLASGQLYRLLTPIFIHFGILHLLMNLLWLFDLGRAIEWAESAVVLAVLVLVIGVGSNFAQYAWRGPVFGGMSGVVYGLLGYAWVRGKLDRRSRLQVRRDTMLFMMVWFVICLTGAVGPVANAAHAGGLGLGLLAGWIGTWRARPRAEV